jgi:hypothetical protein
VATFQVGTRVETTDNVVEVTVTPATPIAPGTHHFQLIVVDEAGNQSDPAVVPVVVLDDIKPTAVLSIEPTQVHPGESFRLNGSKSSDVPPGRVVKFIWTMLD